jgi:hypothetical protein
VNPSSIRKGIGAVVNAGWKRVCCEVLEEFFDFLVPLLEIYGCYKCPKGQCLDPGTAPTANKNKKDFGWQLADQYLRPCIEPRRLGNFISAQTPGSPRCSNSPLPMYPFQTKAVFNYQIPKGRTRGILKARIKTKSCGLED